MTASSIPAPIELPSVSILVCTEGRAEFVPWLGWNIRKQQNLDFTRVEVLVASSTKADAHLLRSEVPVADVRHIKTAPEDPVPLKRQMLLEAAQNDVVLWFDDDDWHSPDRVLSALVELRADEADLVGFRGAYYVDLATGRWTEVKSMRFRPVPITLAVWRDIALSTPFNPSKTYGSDVEWATELMLCHKFTLLGSYGEPPFFFSLRHGRNMSRHTRGWRYTQPIEELAAMARDDYWTDTDLHLAGLRLRLGDAAAAT